MAFSPNSFHYMILYVMYANPTSNPNPGPGPNPNPVFQPKPDPNPSSLHYTILLLLTLRYENAMSILKLGASLEGLLGLQGSMTWTVTQKLGGAQTFDIMAALKKMEVARYHPCPPLPSPALPRTGPDGVSERCLKDV